MIGRPMRSFTEPPGLKKSALPYTGVRTPRVTRVRWISGVQPTVSSTLSYGLGLRTGLPADGAAAEVVVGLIVVRVWQWSAVAAVSCRRAGRALQDDGN